MSIKWTERRFSKSLQLQEQRDFLMRKPSLLPSEPLEDMVSCPIHLGILEKPHQLPCGHSFCLECLERCLKTQFLQNKCFTCPVCRMECQIPMDGAAGWPPTYALNDVITYVQEQKANRGGFNNNRHKRRRDSHVQRKTSIMKKADTLKKLAESLASAADGQGDNGNARVDKDKLVAELNSLLTTLQDNNDLSSCASSPQKGTNSNFDVQYETEVTRRIMRQHCEYKVHKELLSYRLKDGFQWSPHTNCPCIDFDADVNYKKAVFLDSKSNDIVIHNFVKAQFSKFKTKCTIGTIEPLHLRLYQDLIFVSGLVQKENGCVVGVLAKFDLTGLLLKYSNEYAKDNTSHLPIMGFDFDRTSNNIFVCKPDTAEIVVLTGELEETELRFTFSEPELHPQYLAFDKENKEIWASCPLEKTIFILNQQSGDYVHFGTEQLFRSTPSHIICTEDCKILFLDDKLSRVFWIKKQCDFLCIQRLVFGPILRKADILLLARLDDNKILIVDEKNMYISTPAKDNELSRKRGRSCCLM